MTFVPQQRSYSGGLSPRARTVIFWVLMIALAVVLWQMSPKKTAPAAAAMTYSDFMAQVDKGNVSQAHLYESPSTAEVQGQLRQPPSGFRVTISKETIPDLTDRLRKQGVNVQVSTLQNSGWKATLVNLGPFVLILAIWIFLINRRNRRLGAQPPANAPNRPIG
jgi:cell division protease FtsH